MAEKKLICIENTRFIFKTNFSGDPNRDRFGSSARKGNILIPNIDQARELMAEGFNVKQTRPRPGEEENFRPEYYVSVTANYNTNWPPRIYLVSGNAEPRLLDESTLNLIDMCRVKNVNVVLNPYHNQRLRTSSLYVRTMYVEQDLESDPFASRYYRSDEEDPDNVPF